MYGSLTTKELRKTHSSRPVGGVEMGSWVERTGGQAATGRPGQARWWLVDWAVPHLHAINWEEQLGSETDRTTQGSSAGK